MDFEFISDYYPDMFAKILSDLEENLLDLDKEIKSKIVKHKFNELQKTYLETIDTIQEMDRDNGLSIFSSHDIQSKISDIDSLMCKIEMDIMNHEAIENQPTNSNLPMVLYKPLQLVPKFKLIEYLKGVIKNLTKIKELLSQPKIHKNIICDQQNKYIKIQEKYKIKINNKDTTEYKNYIEEIDMLIIELDGLFEQFSWDYDICLRNLIAISKEIENIKKKMNDYDFGYDKLLEISKKVLELDLGYEIIKKNIVSNINDIDRDKYLAIAMVSGNINNLMNKVKKRLLVFSEGKIDICSQPTINAISVDTNKPIDYTDNKMESMKANNRMDEQTSLLSPNKTSNDNNENNQPNVPKYEIVNTISRPEMSKDHPGKNKSNNTLISINKTDINDADLELPILVSSINNDIINNQKLNCLEKLRKIEELLNRVSLSRTHYKYKYLDILKKGFDVFIQNIDGIDNNKKIRSKICMLKKSFTDEIFQ
jgi:hypothetical protein